MEEGQKKGKLFAKISKKKLILLVGFFFAIIILAIAGFFLLNKKEKLENLEDTIIRVKENLINIGFEEPLIFPISAYSALLLHKKINQRELDEDEMIDLDILIKKGQRVFRKQYATETELNALLLENTGINVFYYYLQQLISFNHHRG